MRRMFKLRFAASTRRSFHSTRILFSEPIVRINKGTFYRRHPSIKSNDGTNDNPALFPNLDITLPSFATPNQHWAILSPSSTIRTTFLQVLRGQLLCFPPTARTFPYLLTPEVAEKNPKLRYPDRAIEYVGFDVERKSMGGAYLSARYESLKEETDFTLQRYLTGIITMNPGEEELKEKSIDPTVMRKVMKDLELERFIDRPVAMLSNGQSRRARIGKALLRQPLVLCLDAPFIGLDPIVTKHISTMLHRLAEENAPRIALSLRPQDMVPEWITHLVYAGEHGTVHAVGAKRDVIGYLQKRYKEIERAGETNGNMIPELLELREVGQHLSSSGAFDSQDLSPNAPTDKLSRDGFKNIDPNTITPGEPIVEMSGVRIAYGPNSVLGDWTQTINNESKPGLHFTMRRGQRWGIFGANGSGKTTLLSLVTSDHPQTYSAPVKLFQRSRLPEPGQRGITIFEIQNRMGHASPEVHALFPKYLTVRRVLESAWSETPITKPVLDENANARIDACLKWFESDIHPQYKNTETTQNTKDLEWAKTLKFSEISYSAQRTLLFLRATIRNPEIVILDEAFSGMDDVARDKCLLFLSQGQNMELRYTTAGPQPVESALKKEGKVVVPGLQDHQALLCVSHSRQEIPGCVRDWICLAEQGRGPPRFGRWDGPVELESRRWDEIWDEA